MKTYYCAFCNKEVSEDEITRVPGLMHKTRKSGRVTPIEEKRDA